MVAHVTPMHFTDAEKEALRQAIQAEIRKILTTYEAELDCRLAVDVQPEGGSFTVEVWSPSVQYVEFWNAVDALADHRFAGFGLREVAVDGYPEACYPVRPCSRRYTVEGKVELREGYNLEHSSNGSVRFEGERPGWYYAPTGYQGDTPWRGPFSTPWEAARSCWVER